MIAGSNKREELNLELEHLRVKGHNPVMKRFSGKFFLG